MGGSMTIAIGLVAILVGLVLVSFIGKEKTKEV